MLMLQVMIIVVVRIVVVGRVVKVMMRFKGRRRQILNLIAR